MKVFLLPLSVVFLALSGFQTPAARAQAATGPDEGTLGTLSAAVAQLFTDLGTIPAGSTVTEAQHAALVADLDALAAGIFTPDPADVDQLATDLGTAAAAGLIDPAVLAELADDFSVDPDADDSTDGWLDDIQADVADLLNPAPPTTPGIYTPGIYILGVARVAVSGSSTRVSVQLEARNNPPPLLENYGGSVQLATRTDAGAAPVATLRVSTGGLPPSNPYTVSITRQSDGGGVVIGLLRVHSGFQASEALAAAAASVVPQAEFLTFGRATFGGNGAARPLPTGFDATDVASVTLTDSQGVVRLTGSLGADATPSSQIQALHLRLSGTAVAPAPAPYANVTARHKLTPNALGVSFHLSARHLPANTAVTLLADGTSVGQFTTTPGGRLVVAEGPAAGNSDRASVSPPVHPLPNSPDLSGTRSFSLVDGQGMVLVAGSLN